MNPEASERWRKALDGYQKARALFRNDEPISEIQKACLESIFSGSEAVSKLGERDIAIGEMVDFLEDLKETGSKRALEETRKTLNRLRGMVREDLPEPPEEEI